jgi:3-hydroxyisobutyrate dehydrogenase-like beta-hydroxyacid dehydrogenase
MGGVLHMNEKEENSKVTKTAVIGLGSMGIPMARHMLAQGYNVSGYDINSYTMSKASEMGVKTVSSVQEVGLEAEVVVLMVQTDEQVRDIITGQRGLLTTMEKGSVICVASSISPFTCQELAEITKEKGVGFIDTPVCLGQQAANEGRLTVFVGGEERWVNKSFPVLSSFGKEVIHVGDVGAGQVAKSANNMLLWSCMRANYEVLTMSKKMGMNIPLLINALMHSSGANWSLSRWGKSTGKWSEKDMDVALELAQDLNTPLPLVGLVDQLVKELNQENMRALLE